MTASNAPIHPTQVDHTRLNRAFFVGLTILLLVAVMWLHHEPSNSQRLAEIMRAYTPAFVTSAALKAAVDRGEEIPTTVDALREWADSSPSISSPEIRARIHEFCERGTYLTNFTDKNARHHPFILFFYERVRLSPARNWISTFSSADDWTPRNYTENEARTTFGDRIVDQAISEFRAQRISKE